MQNNSSIQTNRAFLYGDAVFETFKILDSKILFLEDHYFRLMASMRIVRMEIPMHFTMEFLENEIINQVKAENIAASARARITVFRKDGGFYLPATNDIDYVISASILENSMYVIKNSKYEVDLYKDFYVCKHLLSTLKTTNKLIHITGSIYAQENDLDNCILINEDKNVVEALNGNLFMLKDDVLCTPPLKDGCLNGIMRKKILEIAKTFDGLEVLENTISPFDLQKADELFITNVITGVQPITKYRKKEFETTFAQKLLVKLNANIRFN